MPKLFRAAVTAIAFTAMPAAFAAEKTVTFAVANMSCKACPVIVKRSLEGVPGVVAVVVSYEQKAAVVTYDDAKTDPRSLAAASADAGYPATPRN
ncbi:cation transporter [Methylosinus sp. Ce-a6]|uniref:cation transporter n=1 Tax=Methylosinus sp. Ce-a6 TaxID=2172005 RepID=UPI001358D3D9|nr:cation transporter [Methylosinus sp. Ce-a6]